MNGRQAVKNCIQQADNIVQAYLKDLAEADLLVRPTPGINHIAWQLGHLIQSEHDLVDGILPGTMPALPADFGKKFTTDTAARDDAASFLKKDEYLKLYEQQRAGTLAALEKITDADLDQPAPEQFRSFAPTVGDLFIMQGTHWLMHAGQWAVIRRKLGRPPLF